MLRTKSYGHAQRVFDGGIQELARNRAGYFRFARVQHATGSARKKLTSAPLRLWLAEQADKTGIPQRRLANEFSLAEYADIMAARRVRQKENDKDDCRMALLAYYIVSALSKQGADISPATFLPSWDGKTPEQRRLEQMTPEEVEEEMVAKFELAAQLHGWKRLD